MKNILVIIRVFNRLDDLCCNLDIIRKTWNSNKYAICVVSNGNSSGYQLPQIVYDNADFVIDLDYNAGHLKGNSQLLLAAYDGLKLQDYDYCVILEADTWIYEDKIIDKYIKKLEETDAVWASAKWYDRFESLATDFAIIKTSFLASHRSIFDYETWPECYVCNYLINNNFKYIYIKEYMNVQVSSFVKGNKYAPKGRFFVFYKGHMVTHHIELIKGGLMTKKYIFNCISRNHYFKEAKKPSKLEFSKIVLCHYIDKLLPRRSWIQKSKKFDFNKKYKSIFKPEF